MNRVPSAPTPIVATLPAASLYWAVLDDSLPRRLTPTARAALTRALATHIPDAATPAEDHAAAFAPLPDGRTLACAAPAAIVDSHRAHADALVPDSLPAWIYEHLSVPQDSLPDVAAFNLLAGRHEPFSKVRIRRTRACRTAAVITLASVGFAIGALRRADAADVDRSDAESRTAVLLAAYAAAAPPGTPPRDPAAELTHLRLTRAAPANTIDITRWLELTLCAIPADTRPRVSELIVSPAGVTLSAEVPGPSEAERLAAAFQATPGFAPPRVEKSAAGSSTLRRVRVALAPFEEAR